MRPRTVDQVAAAVGGRVIGQPSGGNSGEAAIVGRVSIDSRLVKPGDLFFALTGERTDGHLFIDAAFSGGAAAAVVASDRLPDVPGRALVEVDDPARALMALASDERDGISATVVGITGSTGKTCTKDFTAAVLRTGRSVVASPASFNNEIGVPLTLLSADPQTQALVCEMGARGAGHIGALCRVAKPNVGVVTNVGLAHIGVFGSKEAIANAKAELVEALPDDGTAVLFADDPVVAGYASRTRARVVTFSMQGRGEVRSEDVSVTDLTGRASFALVTPAGRVRVTLLVPGHHMVANALAAAAVGWAMDIELERTAQALSTAEVSSGRMQLFHGAAGMRVLDDAYNANPSSMEAALRTARQMAGEGRCIAVLGEMAELGRVSMHEHERIGELVASLRFDALIAVGAAWPIADAAVRGGMDSGRATVCDDASQATEAVRAIAGPADLVLVKASRVAGLERVAVALRAAPAGDAEPTLIVEALEAAGS